MRYVNKDAYRIIIYSKVTYFHQLTVMIAGIYSEILCICVNLIITYDHWEITSVWGVVFQKRTYLKMDSKESGVIWKYVQVTPWVYWKYVQVTLGHLKIFSNDSGMILWGCQVKALHLTMICQRQSQLARSPGDDAAWRSGESVPQPSTQRVWTCRT